MPTGDNVICSYHQHCFVNDHCNYFAFMQLPGFFTHATLNTDTNCCYSCKHFLVLYRWGTVTLYNCYVDRYTNSTLIEYNVWTPLLLYLIILWPHSSLISHPNHMNICLPMWGCTLWISWNGLHSMKEYAFINVFQGSLWFLLQKKT